MRASKLRDTERDSNESDNGGNFSNLSSNVMASMDELREFLADARGKSPTAVLGMVAQSGLVRSTVMAAGIIFALLVVFTVIPYAVGDGKQAEAKAPVAADGQQQPANDSASSPATDDDRVAVEPSDDGGSGTGDTTLDALGIGDAKKADPKKNPLENSLDNLLDKID